MISSHVTYAPFTLPVLLPSLTAAGVDSQDVFVAVCGARKMTTLECARGTLYYVTHESRTPAAFIEILRHAPERDWYFVLNDTCKAGPRFGELSRGFDQRNQVTAAAPLPGTTGTAQTELGVYNLGWLRTQRELIESFIDCDVLKNAHNEGLFFTQAQTRGLFGEGCVEIDWQAQDIYGCKTLRITEYYPRLDLWKYKSNWGQHGWDKFYETV